MIKNPMMNFYKKLERLNPNQWPGFILSICLAVLFILLTFPLSFILGTSVFWSIENGDVTQYIAGFNSYFTAPWRWPILWFDGFNYPQGTLVTFVDAIPLYAVILKILVPNNFAPFNPFGFFVIGSFILQSIGAWWLAKELSVKSWAFLTVLTLILIGFPSLMARIGHISLMAHWIILFAFALYLRGHRTKLLPVLAWSILLVGSFYVNIYLFVMAAVIYVVSIISMGRLEGLRNVVIVAIPFVALAMSTLITMLPLPSNALTREWGFGYYSMNILSPFTGGRFVELAYKEVPGQYEGFNYLGLGVITAFALGLLQFKKKAFVLEQHWVLLLALCALSIYALSNQIYFADIKVASINYPSFMSAFTSQFRVSGRFFWPVGYFIALCGFLMVYRAQPKSTILLLGLLVFQGFDLHHNHQKLVNSLNAPHPKIIQAAKWDAVLGDSIQYVYFFPKFKCAQNPHDTLLPVMRYVSERGLKMNTGYIARHTPNCNDMGREIDLSLPRESAYIFEKNTFPRIDIILGLFPSEHKPKCQFLDMAFVCKY